MRRLLSLVLIAGMASSSFAQFSSTSMRIEGINPNLAGVLADEYTDALSINTADMMNIKGYRVYTNLSNLHNDNLGADRALDVGPTGKPYGAEGVTTFMLGAFGNPLSKMIPGQMGLFYDAGGGVTSKSNQLGKFGDSILNTTTQTDTGGNGSVSDIGDTRQTENATAKRVLDAGYGSINALYALEAKLLGGMKLGFKLSYMTAADAGAAGGPTYSGEEEINATYHNTLLTNGAPNPTSTENHNQTAKETYTNNTLNLGVGGRIELTQKMDFGATLDITPITIKQDRDSLVSVLIDDAPGATDPITARVTMVDGTQYAFNGFVPTPGTVIPAGFSWTNNTAANQAMGPNGEMNIIGYTDGNEIGSYKTSGTQFGLSADTHYALTDMVKLVGRLRFTSLPGKLDASMSRPFTQVLRSAGIDGVRGAGVDVAGDLFVQNDETSYDISGGKWTNDTIGLTAGGEAKLKKDIKLGFGLHYSVNSIETKYSWTENFSSVKTYDIDNGGFLNTGASGDRRITVTEENSGTARQKTETSTLQVPIGFELHPWPKMPVRLGVTHQIARTKTTNTTTLIADGLTTTVTETGGTTTPTYSTGFNSNEQSVVRTDVTRSTRFYYGMGYQWSENLTFDFLGIASGNDVLDLNDWRIGATLVF